MIVYCIRHGETVYNAEGRLQGHSDLPVLSPLGRRQSEATARALIGRPIEALYASPLRRAYETAEILAKALRLEIRTDPRLKEINVGLFQDQLRADLEKHQADALRQWLSGDPDYVIPGGESRHQLARRGQEAFEAIFRSGHGQVLVVAHGGVLVSTIKSLLGIPLQDPPLALENCSITTLCRTADGHVDLVALNQIEHLAGTGRGGIGDLAV
jgi:2,3-bisphosphoglycerate-dependent phosphoglycerate mutase